MTSNHHETTPNPNRWYRLWARLTTPPAHIEGVDNRQDAQLLAAMTLVLIVLGLVTTIIFPLLIEPQVTLNKPDFWFSVIAISLLTVVYRLSRTPHYRLGAWLAVIVTSGTVFAISLPFPESSGSILQLYLVVPVMLSSVLLSPRETTVLIVLHLLGMLAYPLAFDDVTFDRFLPEYVFVISVMATVAMYYLTQRERQRQHELREYANHVRAMLAAFPDLLVRLDVDGTVLDYQSNERTKLLRQSEEVVGHRLHEIVLPQVADQGLAHIRRTLQTNRAETFEFAFPSPDKKLHWFEARSVPYSDGEVLTIIRNVTAYQEAIQALQRSEASMQALTDAIPDLIFRLDRNGVFLSHKPTHMGLNLPPEAFLGKPITEAMPQLADQALTSIERALANNTIEVFEYQLPENGEPHTYEARISPSGDDEVIAIVRDITEQRAAQNTLREREARYRTLFEESPISLWEEDFSAVRDYLFELRERGITDLATYFYQHPEEVAECGRRVKVLDVNQATLDLIGVEVKDTLIDTVKPVIDDEWYRLFRRELVAFANGMSRYKSETTQMSLGGTKLNVLLTAVIPPAYQHTWERVYVSVTDITNRVRAEKALAASERQLELVLDGAELGLWDWDLTTNCLSFNHWWAAITGHEEHELEQHINTWDAMLHPDDRERVWATRHAHLDRYIPSYECEYRLRPKTGDWVWVLDRGKVVERDENGKSLRMVGTHVDITNRKHIEETARQQRALAEALGAVGSLLTSTLDVDEVLDKILSTIERVVPHDASDIALFENGMFKFVRSQGYDAPLGSNKMLTTPLQVDQIPLLRHMFDTLQPIMVTDTKNHPLWKVVTDNSSLRSYIGAPICWDDNVEGMIGLYSKVPNFFDRTHADRLNAFANQAAIALRNAQWYDTARRRLTEMEVLQQIILDITSQLKLDSLLKSLIENAVMLLDADAGGLYLQNVEDDVLEWSVSVGMDVIKLGTRLKRGEGLSGKVWERGETMTIDNYRQWDQRAVPVPESLERAVLAAPIIWQGQLFGVVNVAVDARKRQFDEHDIWLLDLFASQAATAIQNARLFNAEFEQRALAEALRDTADAINSTLDLHEILDRVLVAVGRVVPYDAANILLVEGDHAYVAHHRGYEKYNASEHMNQLRVRVDSWPMLNRTINQSIGIMINDTHANDEWMETEDTAWVRSMIGVPINSGNRVIGELNLDRAEPHSFSARDMEHVQAFADQAGLALNNARLYAEVRSSRDELEQRVLERTLDLSVRNAVAERLSSSIDTDELLNGVLRVITGQLTVNGGAVYLLSPTRKSMLLMADTGNTPLPDSLPADLDALHDALHDTWLDTNNGPAILSAPIWRREQVEGVIVLLHDEPRPWDESQHRMLDAIGRQLGVALANARSYASAIQGEARIRTILRSVTDGLLVFDKNDRLLLMNPAAEDMLSFYTLTQGGARSAAIKLWRWLRDYTQTHPEHKRVEFMLPDMPLMIEDDPTTYAAHCGQARCGIIAQRNANTLWPCWLHPGSMGLDEAPQCRLYQDARLIAVQAQSASVSDIEGDILGTVIVLNDVTHYRELDELKGRFVSTVSHELRTPLSTILLQIGTLLKYYERFEETERQTMVVEIQEQAQVLRDLVEDILELSRFDANRSLPQKQWFDIVATCQTVLESMQPAIREKSLVLDTSRCSGSRYIMGDPNQLQRVMRNLLSNAIKYTPQEGTITLALHQAGTDLTLSISDSGIGIDLDEQKRIFDRFYRSKDAVDMASGTGLGLSITREIIEMHGGQIELESTPGEGSTFTVSLPVGGWGALHDSGR